MTDDELSEHLAQQLLAANVIAGLFSSLGLVDDSFIVQCLVDLERGVPWQAVFEALADEIAGGITP